MLDFSSVAICATEIAIKILMTRSEPTSLAFTDRGTSFMSDTLHSKYHVAFVCKKYFIKKYNIPLS